MLSETQLAIQLALGMVFLLSAASKLRNPMEFSRGVREYRVVPVAFVGPVSILLIALEISLAIGHLTGFLLVVVIPLGFAALCCFAAAVSINLRRGRALPCYCFGSRNGETISTHTLVRILFLGLGELFLLGTPGLFVRSQIVYPGRIGSFSQLALAMFWATSILVIASWLLIWPEVVEVLRGRDTHFANSKE